MGEPGDEDDQIFSGPALGEDGALRLRDTQPMFLKLPPSPAGEVAPSPGGEIPAPPGEEIPPPPGAPPARPAPPSPVLEPIFDQALVPDSPFQEPPPPPRQAPLELPGRAARPPSDFAAPSPLRQAPVELAERAPRPPSEFAEMPVPDRPVRPPSLDFPWGRWLLVLSLLAIVGGGVFVVTTARSTVDRLLAPGVLDRLLPGSSRPGTAGKPGEPGGTAPEKRVGTPAPSLLVLSEPSGATVLIGGAEVGKTPWAGDNVWPKGPLRIEVRKPGYRSWETTVEGSAERTVEANLKRK